MWHNLATLLRYRGLIQSLVARELKARYRGSVLGFFWSFVNPLLLLSIYSFVFAVIMRNTEAKTQPYAVFMFCGLLPWTWFATSLVDASGSLIVGGNLIKKVLFPAEILPIVSVLTNMVHFLLGLIILAAFMVYHQHAPDWAQLGWFPVIVLVQLVLSLGLAFLVSALTVHFRDLRDLLANLLTFWFFATPIIYFYGSETMKPFKRYFNLNPFFHIAAAYQEVLFFDGPFGAWKGLAAVGLGSIAVFLAGYWLFDRLRDSFAEAV
ncbi:MAG TPA: ABC transporter permease [Vicinamibacterales bacterium]|nr:ABC transporter permease [Vicinamibacterales bacterium]